MSRWMNEWMNEMDENFYLGNVSPSGIKKREKNKKQL